MPDSAAVAAARAELDQAQAAADELRDEVEIKFAEIQAFDAERAEALADFKARGKVLGEAYEPVAVEYERRQGSVAAAKLRLETLEAGQEYEEPPAQGIGGE
jgi:hypothetical protein